MQCLKPPIKVAVVGYGPYFNMGASHAQVLNASGSFEVVAVCDVDKARLRVAKADLGEHVRTYSDAMALGRDDEVQLAVIVVPHSAHCQVALALLKAGKHCVVEKPFAVTVKECDRMIAAAKDAGVTLSVYHNRRWDGEFLTLKGLVDAGWIGDVFHVETGLGSYEKPRAWWRSDKEVSGGGLYDWGAHFVDWMLNLVPGKMRTVTGQFQESPVWKQVTNEDHGECYIKFDGGAVAHLQVSTICASPKPKWYVLGTRGAIVGDGEKFTVTTRVKDRLAEFEAGIGGWAGSAYYEALADHFTKGAPNPVTPESARRVIAVLELAGKSSKTGKEQTVPHE